MADRHVAKENIKTDNGEIVTVSTVFLGLDHSFGDGPPLLFETMIFGGAQDGRNERYEDRATALAGHERAMALVRDS